MSGQPMPSAGAAAASEPAPALPAISVPSGGGALRGIGEKFAANPVTGTGSLSVPVATSPGRAGSGPELTLDYDSGGGNGPYGLGWRLSYPSITRRTDKGLPRYGPDTDVFVLAGAEDLVPTGTAERRTEDGTAFSVERFRPRVERSFARVERWTEAGTGDAHWRVVSGSNRSTVYGRTAADRIADPADPGRVFSWLVSESRDDAGNVVRYEYKPEDGAGVDATAPYEQHRSDADRGANRYLKRVRYGNRTPYGQDWLFEVVLDYGEHDTEPAEVRPWPVRLDPFSSYRAGFEVRTYRLCQRVLMFHHFPDEDGVGPDTLVSSTDLAYRGDPRRGEPLLSVLASVTRTGHRRRPGGGYLSRSLPAVEFDYAAAEIDPAVRAVDPDSAANLPGGSGYRWVDLDGEGVPGALTEQGGGWFYRGNRGGGRFAPARTVATLPSGRGELLDLAGDGHLDLVDLGGDTPGFFPRGADGDWRPFRPFRSRPVLDFDDPSLRLVDLTGDGRADVLVSGDDELRWHPSLAEDGYGPVRRVFPGPGGAPRLAFADPEHAIHLADMSGDGLIDLVRVRNGAVSYWPNLGYGRFGARIDMAGAPWLDEPDLLDQRRVRLSDVDGSGTADLIYLHRDGVRIHRNRCGNGFAPAETVELAFPDPSTAAEVSTVDLLGHGTACLVWSSPLPADAGRHLRYVDLMSAGKPHLLTGLRNNLGAETRIGYAPSTRFFLADKAAGTPWVTTLPFPVHVVERVDRHDLVGGHRHRTRYSYHHGYFDPVEREFHGFGRVDRTESETFTALDDGARAAAEGIAVPPVLTRTWYHPGAFAGRDRISRLFAHEYHRDDPADDELLLPDTVLPPGLDLDEQRQACRALRGGILREELYALDGTDAATRPYRTSERTYGVRLLQGQDGADRPHAVFLVHPRESVEAQHDRARHRVGGRLRTDPRVAHQLTLAVDGFGNVLRSATVAYGRRHPDPHPVLTGADRAEQARRHLGYTDNRYTNAIDEPGAYRLPVLAETRTYEVRGVHPERAAPGATNLFGLPELASTLDSIRTELPVEAWDAEPDRPARRLTAHRRVTYRRDDLTGPLPPGVQESRALPYETCRLVLTPGLVRALYGDRVDDGTLTAAGYRHDDGGWWAPSGRSFYTAEPADPAAELAEARAHFFRPRRYVDQFGGVSTVDYDRYDLLTALSRDQVGNVTSAGERDGDDRLLWTGNDYRVLQPRLVMDANRNRAEVAFDALGLLAGSAVMGKPEERLGDTLDGFRPDLDQAEIDAYLADPAADPWRLLAGATTRIVYDLSGGDARPAVVATLSRERHVSDLADGERPRISQSLVYSDGFGRDVQHKATAEPGPLTPGGPVADPRWTASGWTVFNDRGKPVRTFEPFFTGTHRFEADVRAGVSRVLFYDPLDRVVATLHPDDTWEKTTFDPWRQDGWDRNDTVLADPRTDPDAGGYVRAYLAEHGWHSWHDRRIGGALGPAAREAARRTAAHAATPGTTWRDSLGRVVLDVARNRTGGTDELLAGRRRLDAEGNERETTDALGRIVTRRGFDLTGEARVEQSIDSAPRRTFVDVRGRTTLLWTSRGHRFRTGYDPAHRPVTVHLGGPGLDGEILAERTVYGEGRPGDRANNLRGRTALRHDGSGIGASERFDFKSNLLDAVRRQVAAGTGLPDWSGEVPLEDEAIPAGTRYDALNRPVELRTADGAVVRPAYDAAGQLSRVEATLRDETEPTVLVASVEHNARGQRTAIRYGNGVRTGHDYDPATFLLARLRTERSGTALQDLAYTYDPVGNPTAIADSAQQAVFFANRRVAAGAEHVYDALYRLVSSTGREHLGQTAPDRADTGRVALPHPNDGAALVRYREDFGYDAAGNLLTVAHRRTDPAHPGWTRRYRYEEPSLIEPDRPGNRLTGTTAGDQDTPARFSYDENGNITALPELPVLRWDPYDRLVATSTGADETAYGYDATGARTRKTTTHAGRVRTDRVYAGGFEVLRELGFDGAVTLRRETLHVLDGSRRVALAETRVSGEDRGAARLLRYQLADHLGSAVLELDAAAEILSYEEYHPYGSTAYQAVRSALETPKRYRYTGRERDEESGLYQMGARYYAPWLGRWTSPDPAGTADGPNRYAYVRGNPLRLTDPTGTAGDDPDPRRLPGGPMDPQRWLSQAPAFWQDVTATAKGRGISTEDTANLSRIAQIWGGPPGPIQAGHREPFVLTPAGVTGPVYAQNGLENASDGRLIDRPAADLARAAGQFAREGGADLGAAPRTVYGHPPVNPNFLTPQFQNWTPGGPRTPTPYPGQQWLPFPAGTYDRSTTPSGPSGQLELPFGTGIQPAAPKAPPGVGGEQLELPFGPPPSRGGGGGGGLPPGGGGLTTAGNAAGTLTRGVVPGVAEGEVALLGASYLTAQWGATATAAGYTGTGAVLTATSGTLASGAAAVPVVGAAAVVGGTVGNLAESGARAVGAPEDVAVAGGVVAAALSGAGAGALVGLAAGGIGAGPGALVGAVAGAGAYYLSKIW
ncbi:MAG TPA: SpvB/TcaC N-terminal domain-containing protein [Mycobacteriales bacterium]|nr:SpvB/TcaC N-terminal domain-containing protein [Mycobacteriales bacterium]